MTDDPTPRPLARAISLPGAVGIGLGAILGAGIFVVTGVAAGAAGPALLVGFAIAGSVATANALSSAQLAARYPVSGGTYEYGYRLLGPRLGFAAGWMFLVAKLSAAGTVALGLSAYGSALVPGVPPRAVAVGAVVVFTVLNWLGIRRSSAVNLGIVAITVGTLLLFAGLGIRDLSVERLRPFAPHGARGVLAAAAMLFFAFTGYARIATLGEEVRHPGRTIPRAILLTVLIAIVLYAAVAFAALGAVGADALSTTGAPLARAARTIGGAPLVTAITLAAFTAMLGVILSQLLGLSRVVLAMARRADLPPWLSHIHPRYRVPDRATALIGLAAALLAGFGGLQATIEMAAFTILVYYAITNLAALALAPEDRRYPRFVAAFGLLGCIVLAASVPVSAIVAGLAVLAGGLFLRAGLRPYPDARKGESP